MGDVRAAFVRLAGVSDRFAAQLVYGGALLSLVRLEATRIQAVQRAAGRGTSGQMHDDGEWLEPFARAVPRVRCMGFPSVLGFKEP